MSEGKAYSGKKIKPPFDFYSYLAQVCPVKMNCEQTLTTVAGDKDFVASNHADGLPIGLLGVDISTLQNAAIIIIGRTVNSFAGQNYLDCTVATDNQWQINIDGGGYVDLQNDGKADGQMLDTDWECYFQGIIHPFTFMFDITSLITSISNRIGLRLQNGRSIQDSMIVTLDIYAKYIWRL